MRANIKDEKAIKYHSLLLLKNKKLAHGFFSKIGGVSTHLAVRSLNCTIKSYDEIENVIDNQTIVCNELGYDIHSLRVINQCHTSNVLTINDYSDITSQIQADAMVTSLPNLLLGVRTADCTPILLYEPQNKIIGAIHAGWKGAFADVIENTLDEMIKLGAMLPIIEVAIGPTIQFFSYEVDANFYHLFVNANEHNKIFFKESAKPEYFMFDLPGFCIYKLRKLGVLKIDNIGLDTYSNDEVFFSYRRATHISDRQYGCQISVIGIKD